MKALFEAGLNPFAEERPPEEHLPAREERAPAPVDDEYARLKAWQRETMAARVAIVNAVVAQARRFSSPLRPVIDAFIARLDAGEAPSHLARAAHQANGRKGKRRKLSAATVYRWHQTWRSEGDVGLAPKDPGGEKEIPAWAPAFLEIYRQPQKRTIKDCIEDMGPDAPPYHQVVRFLKRFSNIDILKGRMSGSELRAHRAYTRRDFSDLLPCDIYVADGHSFKAYVAHPVHGKRFLPEVEAIVDVATRAVVGWSTGLAESGQVVADALRHAATVSDGKPLGGLCAILYADRGAGNRAKMNSHEVTGIVARIGGTIKFGIAGNPQARGIVERLNASLWIPSARKLVTYNGKDMDALAQRRTLKIIDKDLKERGTSERLPSWRQFIEFVAAEVQAYNGRPHSSLPKITDAHGRRQHMSPLERWASFYQEGFRPDTLTDEEMRDIFRPQVECPTKRGLVTVFGNQYFSPLLEHHNGERVYVNYDIHDPNTVWVRNEQQQLICEATWNGNSRAWYPVSVVEQARQKRKERRLALKREQIREIEDEARGVVETSIPDFAIVPAEDATPAMPPDDIDNVEIASSPSVSPRNDGGERPIFRDNVSRYEWHLANGVHTGEDEAWVAWYRTTGEWRMLYSNAPPAPS